MKKHFLIIILSLLCISAAKAQSGLNISPLFNDPGRWETMFTASHLEGRYLKPYNLTLFRSITTRNSRIYDEIEQLVEKDGKNTIDKECGYVNGKLYYAFYLFEPKNKKYRYLFYRNSSLRVEEPNEVTVVYIEGYVTLEELKKMFKK